MADPDPSDIRVPELLLSQSPACHWAIDLDGRFSHASGDTQPIFRVPPEKLQGCLLSEVFADDIADSWYARVERIFAGEGLFLRETISPQRIYSLALFPVRSVEGEIILAGGLAQDVSVLITAEQQLRDTALRILKTHETERSRISKFLHDEVGQCLSGAGLQLDLLRMDLEQQVPSISRRTGEIQHLLEGVMAQVRDLSYELNPDIAERAGVYAALDRLVGRSRRIFPGKLRLMADSSLRLPPQVASAMYKIAQEALENAVQHSGCTGIELILKSTRGRPTLEVRDNGKGFDSSDVTDWQRGLGLMVMEHYAAQARVRLEIASQPGKGTVVKAIYDRSENGAE